jgi:hypothetical protein
LETSSRPEVYFEVAIVEPFHHGVDTVLVAENVKIEDSLFHQPQPYYLNVICYFIKNNKYFSNSSCFFNDDWEPDSIDESPCQPETFNVAPGHL